MKAMHFRLISLGLTLTMLLVLFTASVGATTAERPVPPILAESALETPPTPEREKTPPPPKPPTPGAKLMSALGAAPTTPLPQADCALLDDPAKLSLMSGIFETKLLIACGREEELGRVKSWAPAALPSAPFALGNDVLVNDPAGETHPSATQSETSIARNPDTGILCSAYNDAWSGVMLGTGSTGFSHSHDDGATWVDHGSIGPDSWGDPTIVWRRKDGHFYHSALHTNGVGLWDLGAGCTSSTFVGMIYAGLTDMPHMTVDNNPASPYYGRLYTTWTDWIDGHIYVTTSDDAGATWSVPVDISGHAAVQAAWPAVDPVNGDVYVAWVHWDVTPDTIDIEAVRSTDGGVTWNYITNPMSNQWNPRDATATTTCGRNALNGNIRYWPAPQIAVDHNSNLHVVYSYDPDGQDFGDVVNVYYRRSTDRGATWGPEIQLNDDATATDQWFPALAVADNGTVGAFWYDRRLDAANNFMFDYYKAVSYDNGVTFRPNVRVSDVSSPVVLDPNLAVCYHSDYETSAAGNGRFYIQWSDDRRGDPDVWLDTEPFLSDGIYGTVYDATTLRGLPGARLWATLQPTGTLYFGTADAGGYYEIYAPPGTYDVTAMAYGYQPHTIIGITVSSWAQVDLPLDPAGFYVVEGTVTDANTGYPVRAHITVLGAPVSPPAPDNEVWSDPFTGYYSLTLASLVTYTFRVEAVGYLPEERIIGPLTGDASEDFALQPDLATCTAPGYEVFGFIEDFENGVPPAGWSVLDNTGNGYYWDTNTFWGVDNLTDGGGEAAHSPAPWAGPAYDTELRTPILDVATLPTTTLRYRASYDDVSDYNWPGIDWLDLDVSTNGGGTWTNVLHWDEGHGGFLGLPSELVEVDLSPYLSGNNNVIRWHYYGEDLGGGTYYGHYAQIDQVRMTGCRVTSGAAILEPESIQAEGCPCTPQIHEITFVNHTGFDDEVLIDYATSPGVTVLEIPSTLGVVPNGGTRAFEALVKIDSDTPPSTTVFVTVTASLASHPAFSDMTVIEKHAVIGTWEARAVSPHPSMDGAVIEYAGLTYNVGGLNSGGAVDIYDPTTDSWTTGALEPTPVITFPVDACFGYNAVGDPVILLLPDTTGNVVGVWHRYNIATDSWDTPPIPAPLPVNGIWAHDIVVDRANNVCYITGGANAPGGGNLTTLYEYHPDTNTAALLGNFTHIPAGFDFHAGWFVPWIGAAGAVCVGGGVDFNDVVYADTQCYDIAAATFNPPNADLGPLPEPWWGMADMEKEHDGDPQLWIANGIDAVGFLLQRSAYFSLAAGAFAYGPDPAYSVYRVEGDNQLGNIYVVDGSTGGLNPSTLHEQLVQCPDCECRLELDKTGPDWVYSGDVAGYTIVIGNTGELAVTPTLTDVIPAGTVYAGNLSCGGYNCFYDAGDDAVYFYDAIAPYSAVTLTFDVTATAPISTIVVNTATLSYCGRELVDTHEFHVGPLPDLTWEKNVYINGDRMGAPEDGPFTVAPGDTVEIVETLDYTGTLPLFTYIYEDWDGYPVEIANEVHTIGAVGQLPGGIYGWGVTLIPGRGETLTKTFHVTDTGVITIWEWLQPDHWILPYGRDVVLQGPQTAWEKEVYVNDALIGTFPATVVAGDTVEIVDRVWITHTAPVTFTLVETWTESLDLVDWTSGTGSVVATANSLTWEATDVAPDTWHVLTKTFHVLTGTWGTDVITESLWVENADPQPDDWVIQFNYCHYGVTLEPPTDAQSGAPGTTVTYTLRVTNTGNCTDTFDLSPSGGAWPVDLPRSVGPLAGSAGADVEVTVDIPATAADGDDDTVIITAVSQSDGTKSAGSVLTTTAVVTCRAVYLPLVIRNYSP